MKIKIKKCRDISVGEVILISPNNVSPLDRAGVSLSRKISDLQGFFFFLFISFFSFSFFCMHITFLSCFAEEHDIPKEPKEEKKYSDSNH